MAKEKQPGPPAKRTPKQPSARAVDPLAKYPAWYRDLPGADTPTEKQRAEHFLQASVLKEHFEQKEQDDILKELLASHGAWPDVLLILTEILERIKSGDLSVDQGPPEESRNRGLVPRLEDVNIGEREPPRRPQVQLDRAIDKGPQAALPAGIKDEDVVRWVGSAREAFGKQAPQNVINMAVDQYLRHCESLGEATSRPEIWICDRIEKLMGGEDPELRGEHAGYDDEPPPPPPPDFNASAEDSPAGDVL